MRAIRLALLAGLALLSIAGMAQAQLPRDLVSIDLEKLNHTMTIDGQPSKDPYGDEASFRTEGKLLIGPTLAGACADKGRDQGTLNYAMAGGQLSGGGPCDMESGQYRWHFDYQWSSTAALSNGKLVLKGQGSVTKTTLRGCSSCTPVKIEVVEQATLRLTTTGCTVESYSRKETETSRSVTGRGDTVMVNVYSNGPRSKCGYLR